MVTLPGYGAWITDDAAGADAARWGIESGYHDVGGTWHDADPTVTSAVLRAMGGHTGAPEVGPGRDVWVVAAGETVRSEGAWVLRAESGETLEGRDVLPPDLDLGYHELEREGAPGQVRLIVTPVRCHTPAERMWGWSAQLYALRSAASWGIGDLADLATMARWAASQGAGAVLVNPLHAVLPGHPQQDSPYFPSSRVFRNPIYIRVEDVPGATDMADVWEAARAGRSLNSAALIDRDEVWRLKRSALESVWRHAGERTRAAFTGYRARQGQALEDYATFCAIFDEHGPGWRDWPGELRSPGAEGVARFRQRHSGAVSFHAWLQFLADEQMGRAGHYTGIVTDLAIGTDPDGADAWRWQDVLASGVAVGAPPDDFNRAGQNWGFAPFDPWKLRAAQFQPFIDVVRAVLGHAAGVRIDHVAGLFRLWWIPPGFEADRGVYVRGPWEELLAIVALESMRSGAWVVGEDLGTVPPMVREQMGRRGLLSTRVMWFEPEPPDRWPEHSVAAVTTHDLPTVAGIWTGADDRDQKEHGIEPNSEGSEQMRERLAGWAGLSPEAGVAEAVTGAHRLLAGAPSVVALAALDDALAVPLRPNLPGTTERPNWRVPLPRVLEDIPDDPLVTSVAEAMAGRGRS